MFNWLFGPRRWVCDDPNCVYRPNAPPLTELTLWTEVPINQVDGKPVTDLKVVGRPSVAVWTMGDVVLLWPAPDPSKRWRLFIQEDTRP